MEQPFSTRIPSSKDPRLIHPQSDPPFPAQCREDQTPDNLKSFYNLFKIYDMHKSAQGLHCIQSLQSLQSIQFISSADFREYVNLKSAQPVPVLYYTSYRIYTIYAVCDAVLYIMQYWPV